MYVYVEYALNLNWPGQYLDGRSLGVEEGVVAVPTQSPALQGSFGVWQPQLQPQSVPSAAFTSCWQEGHPQPPSFTFYIDHGVSEEHTIPCQWPRRTTTDALVPAGHTKLYSSQLVSISLWLDAWCLSFSQQQGVRYSRYSQPKLRNSWQSPYISSRQQGVWQINWIF